MPWAWRFLWIVATANLCSGLSPHFLAKLRGFKRMFFLKKKTCWKVMDNFLGNSNQPGKSTIMTMVFNLDEYLALVHVLSCLYWKSNQLRSNNPSSADNNLRTQNSLIQLSCIPNHSLYCKFSMLSRKQTLNIQHQSQEETSRNTVYSITPCTFMYLLLQADEVLLPGFWWNQDSCRGLPK